MISIFLLSANMIKINTKLNIIEHLSFNQGEVRKGKRKVKVKSTEPKRYGLHEVLGFTQKNKITEGREIVRNYHRIGQVTFFISAIGNVYFFTVDKTALGHFPEALTAESVRHIIQTDLTEILKTIAKELQWEAVAPTVHALGYM